MDVPIIRHAAGRGVDDATALMRALGDEPKAVVYDLTGMSRVDHLGDSLERLNDYLAAWAGTPLLVACDHREVRQALRMHPTGARLTMWPSVAATLAATRQLARPDRSTLQLSPGVRAPARARKFVQQTLGQWGVLSLVVDAGLVATELVTNGTRHAQTPMTLSMSRPGARSPRIHTSIRLAVQDASADPRALTETETDRDGERGLWVVAAVSRAWGVIPLEEGKSVWTVLDGRIAYQPAE